MNAPIEAAEAGVDDPFEYDGPWIECWQCSGDGYVSNCFEEYACVDPEGGCDECMRTCDICKGKGGWPDEDEPEARASSPQTKEG